MAKLPKNLPEQLHSPAESLIASFKSFLYKSPKEYTTVNLALKDFLLLKPKYKTSVYFDCLPFVMGKLHQSVKRESYKLNNIYGG